MIRRLLPGRETGWLLLLAAALPLALLGATLSGPAPIAWRDVFGVSGGAATEAEVYQRIIWSLRIPRALLAALAGAGLALAGTVLQSLTRNPLADPWVLGISSGAGVGAVTVLVLGLGGGLLSVSGGAFIGALGAFALVMLLAGRSLQGESTLFILAGVAVTQLLSALTSLITLWQADANATRGVMFWLLGSFSDARWPQVGLCGLALAAALLLCWLRAGELDALAFGGVTAASLGVAVAPLKLLLYVVTTALTAAIVAFSGAVGFIGLTVPHVARRLVGSRHRLLLPASALCGALFAVAADTLARTLFAPRELPVGVLTALLGVPVFLLLLYRKVNA
ncbi:ABC transporter permease [Serratia marcescens]|nr:ABC transporter permease [Serratia marcescens]